MGSCLSKKSACAAASPVSVPNPSPDKLKSETQTEKKKIEQENPVKKEIFIIKHRKSHEIERQRSDEEKGEAKKAQEIVENGENVSGLGNVNGVIGGAAAAGGVAAVRTSSCTKEEVDAILIQCGRLSRSSSTGKAAALSSERKYSGSKRSYDFDKEHGKSEVADGDDDVVAKERENRRRERHRNSQGRRRTPSREREKDPVGAAQPRSGSRERGGSGGGGRRVSRSPGRRSESPIPTSTGVHSISNSNSSAPINSNSRPGKMVSVPATVTSINGGGAEATGVKRIQVKRNVGGDARTAGSPRARSPARMRASNENQNLQQPLSLSRSNSRKAEHSPYRRNPLADIDTNIITQAPPIQKPNADNKTVQGAENRINSKNQEQQQQLMVEQGIAVNVISSSGPECQKQPHTVARSRSSRLSRDLDINPETLSSNPNTAPSSYTALLLEDIQNFHQKSAPTPTAAPPASFPLPPCVTKACSILEAVADLNSSTGSNLSTTFSEDRRRNPVTDQTNKTNSNKMQQEMGDPILESVVVANDDLMQPSFHKYVTVRRGGGDDLEEQESSGSNSFVASSCWEPNSAESTDRWASSSSRSTSRQNDVSPLSFQRGGDGGKRSSAKKRDYSDHQLHSGIGRGRLGNRGPHMAAPAAAAST